MQSHCARCSVQQCAVILQLEALERPGGQVPDEHSVRVATSQMPVRPFRKRCHKVTDPSSGRWRFC